MRRARIKATVTVPARRKATQDTIATANADAIDSNEKKPVTDTNNTTESVSGDLINSPLEVSLQQHAQQEIKNNQADETLIKCKVEENASETLNVQNNQLPLERIEQLEIEKTRIPYCLPHSQNDTETTSLSNSTESLFVQSQTDEVSKPHQHHDFEDRNTNMVHKQTILNVDNGPALSQASETQSKTLISSPTKISQNRLCFMKPTPRLDSNTRIRRNSIQGSGASASESEDDTRRTSETTLNRVRNDSVCSTYSVKSTTANTNHNKDVLKQQKATPKRRMLVSESARKLAEARREFLLKHENKAPDRSKLTMYDLIYYNPVSNPMKKSRDSTIPRRVSICPSENLEEAEGIEDDPSSAMPVPQVKVGPDGQLIIDEQSLVIEQTNAKKNKEVLAKEAIIDDDNTGNGFYKRRQKSKEWPKWETLKFYKALNTVGTDFLLMQSLFPKRTRQEIKLKFKKEEKVNRHLVEKALAYHQEFDTDILEKSLATFDDTEREYINAQESKETKKRGRSERKRKSRLVVTSIAQSEVSDEDNPPTPHKVCKEDDSENNNKCNELQKKILKNVVKKSEIVGDPTQNPANASDSVSCSGSHSNSDSDTDSEIYHVRPTRSGRQPKRYKLQCPEIVESTSQTKPMEMEKPEEDKKPILAVNENVDENEGLSDLLNAEDSIEVSHEGEMTESIKSVIPDISQVEPGSLVILSKQSLEEPGKSVLQVYMVSSNIDGDDQLKPNITPVDLSSELLATVTTKLSNVEPINMTENTE